MGALNAVMGEDKEDAYVSHYGLGYRNDRGQTLVDFFTKEDKCSSLIPFKTEDVDTRGRSLETPKGYQIDYVVTR